MYTVSVSIFHVTGVHSSWTGSFSGYYKQNFMFPFVTHYRKGQPLLLLFENEESSLFFFFWKFLNGPSQLFQTSDGT